MPELLLPLLARAALWPADLQPLLQALQRHGFRVVLQAPPSRGAYGQFEPASRTLWIAPISHELGIARQTLLHEATHAAQSCPHGVLTPVGWSLPLSPLIEREISAITLNRYHHGNRAVEREAFALKAGELSGVVQVADRFMVLFCEGYTEPAQVALAWLLHHFRCGASAWNSRFAYSRSPARLSSQRITTRPRNDAYSRATCSTGRVRKRLRYIKIGRAHV